MFVIKIPSTLKKNESNEKLEDLVKERAGDNLGGMVITSTNQVIVKVIEALGLKEMKQ